jgi:hypothetical protein
MLNVEAPKLVKRVAGDENDNDKRKLQNSVFRTLDFWLEADQVKLPSKKGQDKIMQDERIVEGFEPAAIVVLIHARIITLYVE